MRNIKTVSLNNLEKENPAGILAGFCLQVGGNGGNRTLTGAMPDGF